MEFLLRVIILCQMILIAVAVGTKLKLRNLRKHFLDWNFLPRVINLCQGMSIVVALKLFILSYSFSIFISNNIFFLVANTHPVEYS